MIDIHWTNKSASDMVRLYEFLAPINKNAAAKVVQSISKAPDVLVSHPRLGEKIEGFEPREVRRILVGDYEIRYEVQGENIYILRVWHTREHR
jgi:plasmid stabilization system protein ParE